MAEHSRNVDEWQWQEPGQAWKGRGVYHITLTQTDRSIPLMGTLTIPDNDAEKASVTPSPLGAEMVACMRQIMTRHPEVQLWAAQLMPDHIHFVLHVMRRMDVGIMTVVRGFWQGCKASYRQWQAEYVSSDNIRQNRQNGQEDIRRKGQEDSRRNGLPANLFEEMPKVVTMSRRGHLKTMMHYVNDNPRRLAHKRLHPGYFRVTKGVTIAGTTYDAVGNLMLLNMSKAQTIHVHKELVWLAEGRSSSGCNARAQREAEAKGYGGNEQPLRDYMNGCIISARKGALSVSPFISPHEQKVRDVLLKDYVNNNPEPICHPVIYLADNGFPPLYKPGAPWFDAVANGKCLILAPTAYVPQKKAVSREQCKNLNAQAEAIVASITQAEKD